MSLSRVRPPAVADERTQLTGWLEDRYGLSWQIVPSALESMLHDGDPARAKRVMDALLQMTKLDLRKLQQAYDGK